MSLLREIVGNVGDITNTLHVNNLDVSGALTTTDLIVTEDVTVAGNVEMDGNLDVTGNTSLTGNLDVTGNTSMDANVSVGGSIIFTNIPSTTVNSATDTYKSGATTIPFDALRTTSNVEVKAPIPEVILYGTTNKTWTAGEVGAAPLRFVSADSSCGFAGNERCNILIKNEDTFGCNWGMAFGTKRFDQSVVTQHMYLNRQGVLLVGRGDTEPVFNSSEDQGPFVFISGPNKGLVELTSQQVGNTNGGVMGGIDAVNRGGASGSKRRAAIEFKMDGTGASAAIGGRISFLTAADGAATNGTERVTITQSGNVGIGTTSPTTLLDINADTMRLRTPRTIATSTDAGSQGEVCYDANYIYVCVAPNTWKRAGLGTW